MGWATGSEIMEHMIREFKNILDNDARELVYKTIIPIFEDYDCDTLMECMGVDRVFDSIYTDLKPEDVDTYWEDEDDFGRYDEDDEEPYR